MPDLETPHALDLEEQVIDEPTPADEGKEQPQKLMASTDIRDPHVAVHGLDKPKYEVEDDDGDDPDALPWLNKGMDMAKLLLKIGLAILLVVYLLAAFIIDFHRAIALFVITVLVLAYQAYAFWASRNEATVEAMEDAVITYMKKTDTEWGAALIFTGLLTTIMVVMIAATVRDGKNMVSLLGLFVFIGLTWLFSWKPSKVMVRPVLGSIFIQFIFGYIVIRTSWGLEAMQFLSDVFTTLLGYTTAGSSFVFSWLTDGSLFGRPFQLATGEDDIYFLGPPFFFSVLPTVIFFSALMSVGYYIGAIPWAVKKVGYFLGMCLGTSASESLSAAGNIFVGQTEAPLLIRPFMAEMTDSELHAIMTGGFATIAGSVFGLYISFGIDGVAILAASIMSAPAALAISKLAYPETQESPTATGKKGAYHIPESGDANVVHAATNGAVIGTQLMLNIAGNLIAFLAIIEMLDQLIIYLGERVDIAVSFNILCEIFFYPVAWLMGVSGHNDCLKIANVLGLKIFANEFVAYGELSAIRDEISARSYYIASYALCGFSNFGSIGIQLGGLTPLAPNKGPVLAKLVFSAMIAGNTACLLTACIAGIFYEED